MEISLLYLLQFQQSVSSELKSLGRSSYTLCVDSPLVIRQALHPEASKKVMGQMFPHFIYKMKTIVWFSFLIICMMQICESCLLFLQLSVVFFFIGSFSILVLIEIAEQGLIYIFCLPY